MNDRESDGVPEQATEELPRPDAAGTAVSTVLTETRRDTELWQKRSEQPYTLLVLEDGSLTLVEAGAPVSENALCIHVDEGVFPCDFGMTSTLLARTLIKHYPHARHVLEMGAGTGYPGISLAANSTSIQSLTLADILPAAVQCSKKNADKNTHRFPPGCRVTVVESDLFSAIEPDAVFDVMIHNQTFYPGDGLFGLNEDGGQEIITKFLTQARTHLAPGGVIVMNFASFVDAKHDPRTIAASMGFQVRALEEEQSRDGTITAWTFEFSLPR